MSSYINDKLTSGQKLRIFVTGATGYIGQVFTEKAVAAGHTVHALSRSSSGDEKLIALGAVPVRGNLTTHDVLKAEAAKADAVVHLAWNHDFSGDLDQIADVDIAATNAIMSVLTGTGKVLLHTAGSGGYEATADGSPATEDTPRRTGIPIMDARTRSERNVLDRSDVHGALIRLPPYVYGRGGKGFLVIWMSEALKHGESLYIEDGNKVTSVLHVDDAATLYLNAIRYAGKGQSYNAIGSSTTTMKQLAEAVGEVMGLPVRGILFDQGVEKFGQMLAIISSAETNVSSQKAKEQLHWEPQGPAFLEDIVVGSYKTVAKELHDSGNTQLAAEYGIGKK